MKEFKFIRGLYKDESIFSTAEKSSCLFAYDKDGKIVGFDAKNDETFQKRFADLSNEQRLSEIYTLKPNQFTVGATGVPGGSYSFNFTANTNVEDGSISFPEKVKTSAEKNLKEHTTATYNTTNSKPKLNLTGKAAEKTGVTFSFGEKSFTRNLIFNVTGKLRERTYKQAQYLVDEAYPTTSDGKINYGDAVKKISKVFNVGRLQKEVKPDTKTVVSNELNVSPIITDYSSEATTLNLAYKYVAGDNCKILYNGQLKDYITYTKDGLTFDFYSTNKPSDVEEAILDKDKKTEGKRTYYKLRTCNVRERKGEIIKGFSGSYSGYYILKNNYTSLEPINESDLNNKDKINVYSSGDYFIYNGKVYEDDTSDNNNYVMFSDVWNGPYSITNSNAYINNGYVSPQITTEVFRLIDDSTLKVTATQSD